MLINHTTISTTAHAHISFCCTAWFIPNAPSANSRAKPIAMMLANISTVAKTHCSSLPPSMSSACLSHTGASPSGRSAGCSIRYSMPLS